MAVIAIDLGGTKIAAAIFTREGKPLDKAVAALEGRGGKAVGKLIRAEIQRLLTAAVARRMNINAVGVCVPGISFAKTGTVWAPNIPGWKSYPLRTELERCLPPRNRDAHRNQPLRVHIESDRACYILGERWLGAARGCENAIFLAVGTGIGAGILSDGRVLRGAHEIAGAIGWLALDRPFRNEYVRCGCFEYHASGAGLPRVARALAGARRPAARQERGRAELTTQEIFKRYNHGDELAKEVLAQAVEFWGMAVANLVSLLNPERIIFGGGVFGPATQFLDAIHAEAKKWAQPVAIRQVKLRRSQLGADAGLYGAAYRALEGGI